MLFLLLFLLIIAVICRQSVLAETLAAMTLLLFIIPMLLVFLPFWVLFLFIILGSSVGLD
jgi:hypothetical protein